MRVSPFAAGLGPRVVVVGVVALAPLAPIAVGGCSQSSSASAPADASIVYTTVVTEGGGLLIGDGPLVDPFSGSSSSSSGGSGSTSGGVDTGASSGGTDAGNELSDAADDAPGDGAPLPEGGDAGGVAYTPPLCNGTNPCDLRSNTCCLMTTMSGSLTGTCLPGNTSSCCQAGGSCNEATVHCLQALECGGGMSCCGDILFLLGQVVSSCVAVPDGGTCPDIPWSLSQIGVQLCKTDAECQGGQPCVHQSCIYGAVLDMCGLQSASPLNCTAM